MAGPKWKTQTQITREWVKDLAGVPDGKNNKQLVQEGLMTAERNKKGKYKLAGARLSEAGEDMVLQGLENLWAGSAEGSIRTGALPTDQKNMISQYSPGFYWQPAPGEALATKSDGSGFFDKFGTAQISPDKHTSLLDGAVDNPKYPGLLSQWMAGTDPSIYEERGGVPGSYRGSESFNPWTNISNAKQSLPKIRAQFGDRVADKFAAWIEAEIQKARPETKTWNEMPDYQAAIVRQNMSGAKPVTAAPTANWGAINNAALNPNVPGSPGYQGPPPVNPIFAPRASGLFAGVTTTPNVPDGASPIQQQIAQAALLGNIYK